MIVSRWFGCHEIFSPVACTLFGVILRGQYLLNRLELVVKSVEVLPHLTFQFIYLSYMLDDLFAVSGHLERVLVHCFNYYKYL